MDLSKEIKRLRKNCKICKGQGFVDTDEGPKSCKCAVESKRLFLFANADVPYTYWYYQPLNIPSEHKEAAQQVVNAFIRNENQSIYIDGGSYTGKRSFGLFLAGNLASKLLHRNIDPPSFVYTTASQIESQANHVSDRNKVLKKLKDADILMIAEIGKETFKNDSSTYRAIWEEVIAYRINSKATIYTSIIPVIPMIGRTIGVEAMYKKIIYNYIQKQCAKITLLKTIGD